MEESNAKNGLKKILLLDVDSSIPNLALMKLSTYYKSKGYLVELKRLNYKGIPSKRPKVKIHNNEYFKVFASIIFTPNKDVLVFDDMSNVEIGGSGSGQVLKRLPKEIDDLEEDWSLYPENDIWYGFNIRGCPRGCPYCFVGKMGWNVCTEYRTLDWIFEQIKKHKFKKARFMDDNILMYPKCEEILQRLADSGLRLEYDQGIDVRMMTKKRAQLLSKLNYMGEYFFAFDMMEYKEAVKRGFALFQKYNPKPWEARFYVYCSADLPIRDVLYRIEWCKQNKALVYLMRDKNCWKSTNDLFYKHLAQYCQSAGLFKKMDFPEFIRRYKTGNTKRQVDSATIYLNNLPNLEE